MLHVRRWHDSMCPINESASPITREWWCARKRLARLAGTHLVLTRGRQEPLQLVLQGAGHMGDESRAWLHGQSDERTRGIHRALDSRGGGECHGRKTERHRTTTLHSAHVQFPLRLASVAYWRLNDHPLSRTIRNLDTRDPWTHTQGSIIRWRISPLSTSQSR